MFNEFETKMTPDSNWEIKHINILKGFHIAESENELKNGNFLKLETNNLEFSIEDRGEKDLVEKQTDEEKILYTKSYILHIKSPSHHIQIRTYSKLPLEYIIFHSSVTRTEDIGRPLTNYPHLSNIISPLEKDVYHKQNYRGFLNLIILALIISHLRLMYENYLKYGIILTAQHVLNFITEKNNFIYLTASGVLVICSIILVFLTEKAVGKNKSFHPIFKIIHFLNLSFLLVFPVYMHKFNIVNPATGIFVLTSVTIVALKLYSYIHFWYDVRIFIENKQRLMKTDPKILELQKNIYRKIEEVISNYPRNLSLQNLLLFLTMPVLCYQYEYPRTDRIRKRYLLIYFIQFLVCISLALFVFSQYMVPTIANSIKFMKNDDYIMIVERIMKLAIPNVYGWILLFYAFFHCWMNFLAELTRFSDRNFYKDWWNSIYLDQYWRTWNLPTHFWLTRHVYNPLRRRKVNSFFAGGITFFISGVFHEYVISGAIGYFHIWAFLAMFLNFPVCLFQYYLKLFLKKLGYENTQLMNIMFWISFCFLGQPLCFIIYFYNYYTREGKA